jgi:S1-C subfamily serine protease
VRIEVGRQTRHLRAMTVVLFVVLLAVAGAFFYHTDRQRRLRETDIAAIEARTDSILRAAAVAISALEGEVEGLGLALRQSQSDVGRLRSSLAAAQAAGSDDEVVDLRRQLADASQALLHLEAAADVDYSSIVEANQRAVAIIWADLGGGNIQIGTAFAVRSDGTMLTCRHVVAGEGGTIRPLRLAIQFADSHQIFEARLLAVSNEVDLALVKVNIRGGVPTVQGLNEHPDTLGVGAPVAVIGFPLGTSLPMTDAGASGTIARTTFTAGSVSKVLSDLVQIDGYGARGASGSPIFDRAGQVVGILYGGEPSSDGRIILSVPSNHALDLLESQR